MQPSHRNPIRRRALSIGIGLGIALYLAAPAPAQTDPGYTFQGILSASGAPAGGLHTLRLRHYDALTGGMQIGPAGPDPGPTPPDPFGRIQVVPRDPWELWRNILCKVAMPWPPVPAGNWPMAWAPVYTEVSVKGPNDAGFTPLSPRQELTAAPLAIASVYAGRAESLKLPFSATAPISSPMLELIQTGDGPAARFKVQPQPEPPAPMPAIEAISAISAPAIVATNTAGGPGVYASSATGNALHGVSTSGAAGYFQGNVHLTGNLTKAYTTGTSDLALPIAYGYISASGAVAAATPNVSSIWDPSNGRYAITISGESYAVPGYVTVVTPRSATGAPLIATTNSGSGQLLVRVFNLSGTPIQNDFQFVTYKP